MDRGSALTAAAGLAGAVVLGRQAAVRLTAAHAPPGNVAIFVLAFVLAIGLAFVAGRAMTRDDPDIERDPRWKRCDSLRRATAAVSVAAILGTWLLQSRSNPPRYLLAVWVAALAATAFAFPTASRPADSTRKKRRPAWTAVLVAVAFGAAAWARLASLAEAPAVFSGDEANQVFDGTDWLRAATPTDPFGTGWTGTIRLGMIPAGGAAIASGSPIAGPRLPYAVIGVLSVAAAGFAAAAAAGPVAAAGCLAFLAFAPHHVHFSRLASVQILDSLFAPLALGLLLLVRRTGSPRLAALAGISAGLALYGYAGGRVIPVMFLVATVWIAVTPRILRERRAGIAAALVAGFAVAAGPNLRFAVHRFDDWNSRFNQVSVFQTGWLDAQVGSLGSVSAVAARQLRTGTLGLLYADDPTPWFTGYPILGPALLVGAALAGLGWLAGRRRWFAAVATALLVAGNLAGVVLTSIGPAPQRISSLLPALAILAGAAFAGLVAFVPEMGRSGVPWRAAAGALATGVILVSGIRDYPIDASRYSGYGGRHAGLAQSAARLLGQERFRGRPVYLHGWRYVDSTFPSFRYFLPDTRFVDDDPRMTGYTEASFPPGVHLFSHQWIPAALEWRGRLGLTRGIELAHPADPMQDVGYVLVVPGGGAAAEGGPG